MGLGLPPRAVRSVNADSFRIAATAKDRRTVRHDLGMPTALPLAAEAPNLIL